MRRIHLHGIKQIRARIAQLSLMILSLVNMDSDLVPSLCIFDNLVQESLAFKSLHYVFILLYSLFWVPIEHKFPKLIPV